MVALWLGGCQEDYIVIQPGPGIEADDDGSACWQRGGDVLSEYDSPLPQSYGYERYCIPEPDDGVLCTESTNDTASIDRLYLAQTHMMEPEWPLFFLAADRPTQLQVLVTGSGEAPEVRVEARVDGELIGARCLAGPEALSDDASTPVQERDRHFSVTLPRAWMRQGLSLEVTAGGASRSYDEDDLGIRERPELNLVMVAMDVLDYNEDESAVPDPPDDLLSDLASAMPASATRFGMFPQRLALPTLATSGAPTDGVPALPVVLDTRLCGWGETPALSDCLDHDYLHDGDINATALRFIEALFRATGDFPTSYYFGHTGSLFPGGWGGGKAFVSGDFHDVTIHEAGHALSLPHWGEGPYQNTAPEPWEYRYPYGGVNDDGGGRGDSWNYYANVDQLLSPICEDPEREGYGQERSDAMQRNMHCYEMREDDLGPWDGFSDFSALSMFRHMTGAVTHESGTVPYERVGDAPYHLPVADGFPILEFDSDGNRVLTRLNPDLELRDWETMPFFVPQEWDVPVYTVYGSYHPESDEATILYEPLEYEGSLPALVDPTDPETFADLKAGYDGSYGGYFWWPKDLTLRFVYEDGTDQHAIYPYGSVNRDWTMGTGPWRYDMLYFAISVPGDRVLSRVELYHRPFAVQDSSYPTSGNIAYGAHGITADNFMDGATLLRALDL